MEFNPQAAVSLADEWDPTFFQRELERVSQNQGGAMDMSGSAAYPTGAQPQSGMGFGSIFANAPQQGMAPIGPVPGMQQPPPQPTPHAPGGGVPPKPPPIQFPMAQAQGPQPKSLRDILGGR